MSEHEPNDSQRPPTQETERVHTRFHVLPSPAQRRPLRTQGGEERRCSQKKREEPAPRTGKEVAIPTRQQLDGVMKTLDVDPLAALGAALDAFGTARDDHAMMRRAFGVRHLPGDRRPLREALGMGPPRCFCCGGACLSPGGVGLRPCAACGVAVYCSNRCVPPTWPCRRSCPACSDP